MTGKIALITGASRGIGLNVAKSMAKMGYSTILLARNSEALRQACQDIQSMGGKADYFCCDVSDYKQVESTITTIVDKYGKIDVLFNNAGVLKTGTFEISENDTKEMLRINLEGAIFTAQVTAKVMKQQSSGYIINLASTSGKTGTAGLGIYNASKFGLVGFSEALAKEMAAYNVKVTAICPSMIATEMTQEFNFEQQLMIEPSDIAKTVAYLLDLGKNAVPSEIVIKCLPSLANQGNGELKLHIPIQK